MKVSRVEQKELFFLKEKIKETLLNVLYEPSYDYMEHILAELVRKNNLLYSSANLQGTILYKGEKYEYLDISDEEEYWKSRTFKLKDALIPEFEKYLEEAKHLKIEEVIITRAITVLLNKIDLSIETLADLKEILGENIYNQINPIFKGSIKFFSSVRTLSDTALHNLVQENQQYIDIMQQRIIDNLIAKDLFDI